MNNNLQHLIDISQKSNRNIIGLMSGTSLDGLDIALCNISGTGINTKIKLVHFKTVAYEKQFQEAIRKLLSQKEVDLQHLCQMHQRIGKKFAALIHEALQEWQIHHEEIDLIASHGQTIFHDPQKKSNDTASENSTLQIGDGDQIAFHTGIITISDFRQKHIAAGGEGAPLAAYGDFLLFNDKEISRVLVNIGGISNCTFIPANEGFDQVICTDIGPGNTLIDNWICKHYPEKTFDKDAEIAKTGKVNYILLEQLLSHPFFQQPLPKTTGQEIFNIAYVEKVITHCNILSISHEDVLATLTALTANCIINTIDVLVAKCSNIEILLSGGGIHNPLIMDYLKNHFEHTPIFTTDQMKMNPDAKEAILFAILANETISGNHSVFGKGTNGSPAISMGKISLPQ